MSDPLTIDISNKISDYRSIIKSISIFGGVQIYQILVTLVKAKFVALFLGVVGMGISGLLTSTVAIVAVIVSMGLNYGVVRELAQASHEKNLQKLDKIYTIFSRWLYFTSLIGVIVVILFSPHFSKLAFGNQDYTWAFAWLSITLFFDALSGRNKTLLQGTRRIQGLAKSSVVGSTLGLLISIPLYYYFGIKGIVPALIFAAITSYSVSYFFVRKMRLSKINLSIKQTIFGGNDIVKLGIVMIIALLVGRVVTLSLNLFISHTGSLADVGLYSAGLAITSQLVGLVFAAMSLDYFPRLSAISSDNFKVREMVNHQSEITLLIILPIIGAMVLFAPILIKIFLTSEFGLLNNFIRIIAFGTIFQAAGYTISFIFLAKGDKKIFFIWQALIPNCEALIFLILGYKLYGLNGLAIASVIQHIVSFFTFIILTRKLYDYLMSRTFIVFLLTSTCIVSLELVAVMLYPNVYGYSIGGLVFVISITYSLYNLNNLLGLNITYNRFLSSFINKR